MKPKLLRRLDREELLRLLIKCVSEKEILQNQLAEKDNEILALQNQIENHLPSAGSLASEALNLNHVFENAQSAADQYLDEIEQMKSKCEQSCAELWTRANNEASALIEEAKRQADELKEKTKEQCEQLQLIAERDSKQNWNELNAKLEQLSECCNDLRSKLDSRKKGYKL